MTLDGNSDFFSVFKMLREVGLLLSLGHNVFFSIFIYFRRLQGFQTSMIYLLFLCLLLYAADVFSF